MKRILLLAPILWLTLGCATSAKTTFTDADGTSFTAIAKAGPFGQLDTTNQHLAYKWNATDGSIAVGNEAQGLDNSGQVTALQAGLGSLTDLLKTLSASGLLTPAQPSAAVPRANLHDEILQLLKDPDVRHDLLGVLGNNK